LFILRLFGQSIIAAALFGGAFMGVAAKADTAVERGLKVVREHCTRCHVVPGINPYGGIGSTPSFSAMKWLDDWAYRFEIFYILPPHPSLVRIEGVSEPRSDALPAFSKEIILTNKTPKLQGLMQKAHYDRIDDEQRPTRRYDC
jgi:mono/diheme cytochrome c family protein